MSRADDWKGALTRYQTNQNGRKGMSFFHSQGTIISDELSTTFGNPYDEISCIYPIYLEDHPI